MRTEYSYEAENIEPFCDLFYIDCFYNALMPILKKYGVDKKVIMGSFVPVICKEEKLGATLEWKCVRERRDILREYGIIEETYMVEQDICEAIKKHLDEEELVIAYIDCFYEKGRFDTYMTEHWPHTILIYGYDELEEEFSILEHTAKENLDYAPRKISYGDLIKCYRSVIKIYGGKNKPSLYCFKKTDKDLGQTDRAIRLTEAYALLSGSFDETGKALRDFKEKMIKYAENEEEYLKRNADIVQFLTDVINSKIAFEYVMELYGESELREESEKIKRKWQSIRYTVAKDSYASKTKPEAFLNKLELLDEIEQDEQKLIKEILKKRGGHGHN